MTSKAETCYQALLTILKTVPGMGLLNGQPNVTRRQIDLAQVDWASTPALFITQDNEEIQTTKGFEGVATKQMLNCHLVLYLQPVTQEAVCSTAINDMVQNVRTTLYPPPGETSQTLNNTVSHCWISGKIEIIEGLLNNQGFAIIPVSILTNF